MEPFFSPELPGETDWRFGSVTSGIVLSQGNIHIIEPGDDSDVWRERVHESLF